jgi:hypothetical protein
MHRRAGPAAPRGRAATRRRGAAQGAPRHAGRGRPRRRRAPPRSHRRGGLSRSHLSQALHRCGRGRGRGAPEAPSPQRVGRGPPRPPGTLAGRRSPGGPRRRARAACPRRACPRALQPRGGAAPRRPPFPRAPGAAAAPPCTPRPPGLRAARAPRQRRTREGPGRPTPARPMGGGPGWGRAAARPAAPLTTRRGRARARFGLLGLLIALLGPCRAPRAWQPVGEAGPLACWPGAGLFPARSRRAVPHSLASLLRAAARPPPRAAPPRGRAQAFRLAPPRPGAAPASPQAAANAASGLDLARPAATRARPAPRRRQQQQWASGRSTWCGPSWRSCRRWCPPSARFPSRSAPCTPW